MDLKEFVEFLSSNAGISGYEAGFFDFIKEEFSPFADEVYTDKIGNVVVVKKGIGEKPTNILLAAHLDEIGLMVTKVEDDGFLRFTSVGGIDTRTLLGQEVDIHGIDDVWGIIGILPPHLKNIWPDKKDGKIEDLIIDTGLKDGQLQKIVNTGDVVSIKRQPLTLLNNNLAGKALDDRAGVASLYCCLKQLNNIKHEGNVFVVLTSQEEVGTRGATIAGYSLNPDFAIAVDVCHGDFPGAQEHEVSPIGKGPVITRGPNIHPLVEKKMTEAAKKLRIPYNVDVFPGATPTDARAFQISREGIPSGLLSIPLRYMHTSVEMVNIKDVQLAGELLAATVCSFTDAAEEDTYAG